VRVDLTPGSVSALPLGKSMPPSTAMIVRGPIRGGGNDMFTAYVGGLARNHICSASNTSRSAAPSADRFETVLIHGPVSISTGDLTSERRSASSL
jgi:hypothetical protein